jgi:hypothetical protein
MTDNDREFLEAVVNLVGSMKVLCGNDEVMDALSKIEIDEGLTADQFITGSLAEYNATKMAEIMKHWGV